MRIEFDPTNPDEATAVRAMLTALGPTEVSIRDDVDMDAFVRTMKAGITETMGAAVANRAIPNCDDPSAEAITVPDVDTDTDSKGTPWDPRIHSTPPSITKSTGTWRAKRGVTADVIAAVRAEREAIADENSGPIEIKPEDFKAHVEEMTNGAATVDSSGEVVKVSAAPTPPSAPPAPSGQSEAPLAPESATTVIVEAPTHGSEAPTYSFLDVMKAITAAQKDGKIDTAKVKELCAAVGAGESTMGLNGPDNGDKRGAFMALLGEVVL